MERHDESDQDSIDLCAIVRPFSLLDAPQSLRVRRSNRHQRLLLMRPRLKRRSLLCSTTADDRLEASSRGKWQQEQQVDRWRCYYRQKLLSWCTGRAALAPRVWRDEDARDGYLYYGGAVTFLQTSMSVRLDTEKNDRGSVSHASVRRQRHELSCVLYYSCSARS